LAGVATRQALQLDKPSITISNCYRTNFMCQPGATKCCITMRCYCIGKSVFLINKAIFKTCWGWCEWGKVQTAPSLVDNSICLHQKRVWGVFGLSREDTQDKNDCIL